MHRLLSEQTFRSKVLTLVLSARLMPLLERSGGRLETVLLRGEAAALEDQP